jgi:Holliday junction DNA helicase RuvA
MIASIRTNNLARLTLIPGIGRKTAERLVVELREKVAAMSSAELEEELGARPDVKSEPTEDSVRADALSALLNLGYQRRRLKKPSTVPSLRVATLPSNHPQAHLAETGRV